MNNMLDDILNDIKKYKRTKEELSFMYVNERLSKSLKSYYDEINNNYKFLDKKNKEKLFKQIGRDSSV